MSVLQISQVCKSYDTYKAVDNISFAVEAGTIFGLLGPNGAGKTSLIRIITGITKADSGQVFIDNNILDEEGATKIGYMPEERGLYKKMQVGEQLMYLCQLRGMTKADAQTSLVHWFKKFEIETWWNKRVDELSKGMSQKVQFIATIAHNPKLIILDEPFSGLDPINSNLIKQEIIDLRNKGASIIFSTHRMEQVEEMCQEIGLVNKGKMILSGKVTDIKQQYKEHIYELESSEEIDSTLFHAFTILEATKKNIRIQLNNAQHGNSILQIAIQNGIPVLRFLELLPTFNEIFIKTVNTSNHA